MALAEHVVFQAETLDDLPLTTRFSLGPVLTPIQEAFLERHGFLLFDRVASRTEVDTILGEMERIERQWLEERRKSVFGIPLFLGRNEDHSAFVQRLPFTSCFSDSIGAFVNDMRFEPIRRLIGTDTRVGDREKDGVVLNRYINVPGSVYPRLGWHTDGLRSLAYLRMPTRMLNIGLHLDDCDAQNGGLRLIPGTHKQGFLSMCFRKLYFLSHAPDPKEIVIETRAGDLTVHDGRLWHRVARSQHTGRKSLRRTMYVPYLTDGYQPKNDSSPTPIYHRFGIMMRRFQEWRLGKKAAN